MDACSQFSLNRPRFDFRAWEDGGVVHDNADASLWEITASSAAVLAHLRLAGGRASLEQIARALFGEDFTPEDVPLVATALEGLQSLGVVRMVAP